jgi:hypothetical protein
MVMVSPRLHDTSGHCSPRKALTPFWHTDNSGADDTEHRSESALWSLASRASLDECCDILPLDLIAEQKG